MRVGESEAGSHGGEGMREARFASLLESPVVDVERLRSISWAGVPGVYRARVWRLFLDYEPLNESVAGEVIERKRSDYFRCLERIYGESQQRLWTSTQKATIEQINHDLPRTSINLLKIEEIANLFRRVLFVWAVRHPASGYVQGMNDLLRPFVFVFLLPHVRGVRSVEELVEMNRLEVDEEVLGGVEADSFWCFSKLLDGMQDMFTRDQPGIHKMLGELETVISRVDDPLARHMEEEGIVISEFAFRWMNCLLVRELPHELLIRLWDLYVSNYSRITRSHVFICAALLESFSSVLMKLRHEEFITFMQSMGSGGMWRVDEVDSIIAQGYVYERMFLSSPSHMRSSSAHIFKL